MTREQIVLVRLLSKEIGINTVKELEDFKEITKAKSNELLLKRLALYVAAGFNYNDAKNQRTIFGG